MKLSSHSVVRFSKETRAFAAMELVMIVAAMGIATFVVTGLMSLVAKTNKRSADTSLILEIRNQINSINKNPEEWLQKMRGKYSLYAGCIPDAKTPRYIAGQFACPNVIDDLENVDSPLNDKLGLNAFASYAPIIGPQGDVLAGTDTEPVYLNQNGKICEGDNIETTCPLKSTGFLVRSTDSNTLNPGNVRFIVKVERNLKALAKHSNIFKPEYFTVELGTAWRSSEEGAPPAGSIKIGYLTDGTPSYINPAHQCDSGKVYVGADESSGAKICKAYPTDCGEKKSAALVSVNAELVCSDSSTESCKDGEVFLGHFAGTGEAICNIPTTPTTACGTNQLQVGLTASGTPNCVALRTCTSNEKLSFSNNTFSCQNDSLAQSCPTGKIMTGINSDNTLKCEDRNYGLTLSDLNCPEGEYVSGLNSDGTVVCRTLATASSSSAAPRCTGSGWVNITCYNLDARAWRYASGAEDNNPVVDYHYCSYRNTQCAGMGGVVSDIDDSSQNRSFKYKNTNNIWVTESRGAKKHSCMCY